MVKDADYLSHMFFLAGLFSLRQLSRKKQATKEQFAWLWAIHSQLGCPPLPLTLGFGI